MQPRSKPVTAGAANSRTSLIIGAPLFSVLSAYGIYKIIGLFNYRKKTYVIWITTLIVAASIVVFWKSYFLDYPKYSTGAWDYGMREAITYAKTSSYSCVIVSSRLAESGRVLANTLAYYILFYTQYSPYVYQLSPIPASIKTNYSLGKYHIALGLKDQDTAEAQVNQLIYVWKQQGLNDRCLFIIKYDEIKRIIEKRYNWDDVHVIKTPYGAEVVKLIEVKGEKK